MEKGERTVSSRDESRQLKIPFGSCRREEVVNPRVPAAVPSSSPARTAERPRRDATERSELMEQVVARENMVAALAQVTSNKGVAGIDGMKVRELKPYLRDNWARIREELLGGVYKPQPVRRVEIPKPDGGVRLLGIPTVVDRLIQQALHQVLTPVFDPGFSESSYGFRRGRSAKQAVLRAREHIKEGFRHVVDMDLAKFFDRVNHDKLMARVARKVTDKRVLRLTRSYLEAGVMIGGMFERTKEGTPQGGPLSPLLANIMLDDLDKELEKRGHRFVRYADDCNIYVKSRRAGERVMGSIRRYVEGRLKLKVNEEKSAVDRPWRRKFLGFSFTNYKRPLIRVAPKSLDRFKDKVRELTSRRRSMSLAERIHELNQYLRGWMGYFKLAETRSIFEQLDGWIRRRLRMCLLKQWKRGRTRVRELMALGILREEAAKIGGSRKGYWRLTQAPQVKIALGLDYFKSRGLFSLSSVPSTG